MKFKFFLFFATLFIVTNSCNDSVTNSTISQKQPNILFIFSDDQRFNTINALGNKEIITPHLDALVKDGTSFTNAYIMGAMNGAVCAPSRAMLMTGRSLFNIHPAAGNTLEMPDTLFPRALAMNGYNNFHTGKWHNGKKAFNEAFDAGSKIFFGGMSDQYAAPTFEFNKAGNYPDSLKNIKNIHSSELYANAAIDYLSKIENDDEPFMMYVAFQTPHDPRNVPQKYLDLYDELKIELPPNFLPEHPFDNGELDIRDEWLAGFPRTKHEVKANLMAYYAMITHMDEQIGRIISELERKGLRENTIIVYSSDNGLAVGQHGLMGKQNLYEHSLKVPLIFQGSGIPKNVQNESLVYLIDIYPTLCELTNTEIPSLVEGKSLVPILKGKKSTHRSSMVYAYKSNQRAYREGDFKLIKYLVDGKSNNQLFNIKDDLWETKNLYHDKKHQKIVINMEKNMQSALTIAGDQVNFKASNWGIKMIPRWINKVSQKTIDWLRGLAEEERKMRGF